MLVHLLAPHPNITPHLPASRSNHPSPHLQIPQDYLWCNIFTPPRPLCFWMLSGRRRLEKGCTGTDAHGRRERKLRKSLFHAEACEKGWWKLSELPLTRKTERAWSRTMKTSCSRRGAPKLRLHPLLSPAILVCLFSLVNTYIRTRTHKHTGTDT